MAVRMSILFDGFNDLAYKIDKAGKDLKPAVEEALNRTQEWIQINLTKASEPYSKKGRKGYATGKMYSAILSHDGVKWEGDVAKVSAGFDLDTVGGYHSIFIMYGTKVYGTPRIEKDTKVYNAIKGRTTQKNIKNLQSQIMMKHLGIGETK